MNNDESQWKKLGVKIFIKMDCGKTGISFKQSSINGENQFIVWELDHATSFCKNENKSYILCFFHVSLEKVSKLQVFYLARFAFSQGAWTIIAN